VGCNKPAQPLGNCVRLKLPDIDEWLGDHVISLDKDPGGARERRRGIGPSVW